jgi:SWIM zinc finger
VTNASLAHPAHRPNSDTRELRALALAEEHLVEIALSHRGGLYTVPSLHGEHRYDVTYTAREESCSCPGWQIRGATCYHVLAAAVVRAKTGVCSGCGRRFRHRDLTECVEGNHDDLTYFDGDLLCPECADAVVVAY